MENRAVGIVLDENQTFPLGHADQILTSAFGHDQCGRIVQRGIEIDQARAVLARGLLEQVRTHPVLIGGNSRESAIHVFCECGEAGIGEMVGKDHLSLACSRRQNRSKQTLRAAADSYSVDRQPHRSLVQPKSSCRTFGR